MAEAIAEMPIPVDLAAMQLLAVCRCGRQLSTTHLKRKEVAPLLSEAQVQCGSCQSAFRIVVIQEA